LSLGLWAGIAKFGWFNGAIAISTTPTENELVLDMSKHLTEQLISDAIAYKNANAANRESARATMHETAARRQAYVKALMKEDPDTFLSLAITPDIKQELLQEVKGLEAVNSLEGKLEIVARISIGEKGHDHANHFSRTFDLFLVLPSGETKNLYLPESVPVSYNPNDQIRVTGYELDGAIIPNITADTNNFTIIMEAAEPPAVITPRQIAVILANVEDTELPSSFTKESALQTLDDTSNWYTEASFDNVAFFGKLDPSKSADIFGVYRVSAADITSSCDNYYSNWRTQAKSAATTDGFVAAGYQHIIIMVNKPSSMPCVWSGVGTVGGVDTMQFGVTNGSVTIHELGHNLNLAHATRLYNCRIDGQAVAFSKAADCSYSEYGDYYSAMGNSTTRGNPAPHFSAVDKFKLGWIPATNVATVATSGVYDLYPSELPSNGTQLIRIPTPYNLVLPVGASAANGTAPFYYYLELRKPIGVESGISATYKDDFNGIFLRTGSGIMHSLSYFYQLGSLPGAETCTRCTSGLRPGMVFEDPQNPGMTIRVLSWTPDKATVEIKLPEPEPPICTRNTPTIAVNPTSGMADPGDSINYNVTITSNDSESCSAINYTATSSSTTTGFTYSPTSRSWNLAPSASGTQVFSVTSPSSSTDGLYTITFTVTNSDNTNSATRDVSFVVANTQTVPPSIIISGVTKGETIRPDANTKIIATATHAAGISKVEIYIDNQLVARCNEPKNGICDVFVKGSNTAAGTHALKVIATAKDTDQTTGTANLTFNK